ncbi:MAG: TetR/AcrR family transcriptional regulator [Acidobacteriota bacterium]
MRYPPGHKEETRRRILSKASALFRSHGVQATGLPEVMKAAGLTVGGFYRHFDSKSALFRETLERALDRTLAFLRHSPAHVTGRPWLGKVAARYLSREHLDNVAHGCPLPALTPEIARADAEVRTAYGQALEEIVEEIASRIPEGGATTPREQAWSFMALNVGGLMLARATDDPSQAEEILRACRQAIENEAPARQDQ